MKYKRKEFRKRACCHVSVIAYAQNYGEEKNVLKRIEEVSKLSGISKRALQYYDDEGLLRAKRSKYSSCRIRLILIFRAYKKGRFPDLLY